VKNDKKDALAIAMLAKYKNIKVSLVPEPQILSLRMLVREYFSLADNLTDCKLRFMNDLRPRVYRCVSGAFFRGALAFLKDYPSLKSLQTAFRKTRRRCRQSGQKKSRLDE